MSGRSAAVVLDASVILKWDHVSARPAYLPIIGIRSIGCWFRRRKQKA